MARAKPKACPCFLMLSARMSHFIAPLTVSTNLDNPKIVITVKAGIQGAYAPRIPAPRGSRWQASQEGPFAHIDQG
ncbi:MAG: hypothetical protein SVY53_10380 [Chloroflexota bacterium]|nr:hypothetical protein [Chloroflexota bacterium]